MENAAVFLYVVAIGTLIFWAHVTIQNREIGRKLKELRDEINALKEESNTITRNQAERNIDVASSLAVLEVQQSEITRRIKEIREERSIGIDLGSGPDRTTVAHLEVDANGNVVLINAERNHEFIMEPRRQGRKLDLE